MTPSTHAQHAITTLRTQVLEFGEPEQGWHGQLSSSPLATALANFALSKFNAEQNAEIIQRGNQWLMQNQNPDGGWGDSPESPSNFTTSLLVWCTIKNSPAHNPELITRTETFLAGKTGSLTPVNIRNSILREYGQDLTFSAPILAMAAAAGVLGHKPECWRLVPQLPMELAVLPGKCFSFLRMEVVSYALPALIAIGMARHKQYPASTPRRQLRKMLNPSLMRKLSAIQPANGGFLEATPLTAFVTMALCESGEREHAVTRKAVEFLRNSQRPDGSWPIDSDLSQWLSSLAISAIAHTPEGIPDAWREPLKQKILAGQYRHIHPYTGAAPGGWAWTQLPGAVPDADDTAAALIALYQLAVNDDNVLKSAAQGVKWLMKLQNRDGGIPTFCRGWGRLPFDRSCPDISAHALRAFSVWRNDLPEKLAGQSVKAAQGIIEYLRNSQLADGSWNPLWFGSQNTHNQKNPVYGTARVLIGTESCPCIGITENKLRQIRKLARDYLMTAQQRDGGWGANPETDSGIEETALAVRALCEFRSAENAVERGIRYLQSKTDDFTNLSAAPIGLYFSHLWYSEKLYPAIFCLDALNSFIH